MASSIINLLHQCRGQIAGTIVSYKRGWPADLTFTADLVSKLITDMSSLASEPETRSFKLLKPLLGFSACIAAICRACAEANTQIFTGATLCNPPDSLYSNIGENMTRLADNLSSFVIFEQKDCLSYNSANISACHLIIPWGRRVACHSEFNNCTFWA